MPHTGPRRLPVVDAAFLRIETPRTPMHVASLQVFTMPSGADSSYVPDLVDRLRTGELVDPWNLRLADGALDALAPSVVVAENIDMEYHVRHTALPMPGGERQLGELISYLHGVALDRSRPLWTCHVIEGLSDNRFAIYTKIHHALTDGVNGVRLISAALADEPDGAWAAPWRHRPIKGKPPQSRRNAVPSLDLLTTPVHLAKATAHLLVRREEAEPVRRPFDAPQSTLNQPVTAARRVATAQIELARLQEVAQLADVSTNDVLLAVCSAALRRHMLDEGVLPAEPLVAGVPMSLRQQGETGGNAVTMAFASLATDEADPVQRLQTICASTTAAKNHMRAMPLPARRLYSLVTGAPVAAAMITGVGTVRRPPMNIVISNVPGPDRLKYLNGARLDALYPVSTPASGLALNITAISYAGRLDVGFTGARDNLPHLQRLAGYVDDALTEIETAFRDQRGGELSNA